jgi:hypothetical protein
MSRSGSGFERRAHTHAGSRHAGGSARSGETSFPKSAIARLFAADSETLPALRASPLQHEPAVLCAHPDAKTVRPLAPAGIRLECALTLHEPSFRGRNEPSMLSNGFERCQCNDRLCYSRRPSTKLSHENARRAHAHLVSPQSFPHLWKKLWKNAANPRHIPVRRPFFAGRG